MTGRPASLLLPDVRGPHVETLPERLAKMITDRFDVERAGHPKGPGERSALLGGTQTVRTGVEPGPSPRTSALGIGHQHPVHDHHSQQLGGQRHGTATYARSSWAEVRGDRTMTLNHERVYLLTVSPPNRISAEHPRSHQPAAPRHRR